MINGYLFFTEKWNGGVYRYKLQRRFWSLFVPYVLFIVIAMIVIGLLQCLMPQMASGNYKLVKDYGLYDYLLAFWRMQDTNIPYVVPLWFVRNMMVAIVLSSIYKGIKIMGVFFPLVFIAAWVADVNNSYTFLIPSSTCLAFFSFGRWLRCKNINMVVFLNLYGNKALYYILYC